MINKKELNQNQLMLMYVNQNTIEGQYAFDAIESLGKSLAFILNKPIKSNRVTRIYNIKEEYYTYYQASEYTVK